MVVYCWNFCIFLWSSTVVTLRRLKVKHVHCKLNTITKNVTQHNATKHSKEANKYIQILFKFLILKYLKILHSVQLNCFSTLNLYINLQKNVHLKKVYDECSLLWFKSRIYLMKTSAVGLKKTVVQDFGFNC